MKAIAPVLSVLAASILFSSIAIFVAENYSGAFGSYGKGVQSNHKNECLIVAKNCATESGNVQQRLIDLGNEISKGLKVYTPGELNILKEQHKWIESDSKSA
jgi:hypothetical protein